MVATGHTGLGVIVGVTAYKLLGQGNLATGLIITGSIGVFSHYLADSIPHGHFFATEKLKKNIGKIIIFDVFIPILFFLGVMYLKNGLNEKLLYVMFAIGGAQLPDVIDGLMYTGIIKAKGLLKFENIIHQALHWHGKGYKTLKIELRDIWQLVTILLAILVTFIF